MPDKHTWDLEPFVDQAMHLTSNKERTINQQRVDFEHLVAAVAMHSREKLLEEIREERRKEYESESRKPHRL